MIDGKDYAFQLAMSTPIARKQIENAVADLMIKYGPDGHCDGCDVIAHFILELLEREAKNDI